MTACNDEVTPDVMFSEAPVAVVGISLASRDTPIGLSTKMGTVAVEGLADNCNVTVATMPFAIVLEFTPVSRQMVEVAVGWHWIDLLASTATGPADTEIEAISEEE